MRTSSRPWWRHFHGKWASPSCRAWAKTYLYRFSVRSEHFEFLTFLSGELLDDDVIKTLMTSFSRKMSITILSGMAQNIPLLNFSPIRARHSVTWHVCSQPTTFLLTSSAFQDLDVVIMMTSPLKKVKNSKYSDRAEIRYGYVFEYARHDGDAHLIQKWPAYQLVHRLWYHWMG